MERLYSWLVVHFFNFQNGFGLTILIEIILYLFISESFDSEPNEWYKVRSSPLDFGPSCCCPWDCLVPACWHSQCREACSVVPDWDCDSGAHSLRRLCGKQTAFPGTSLPQLGYNKMWTASWFVFLPFIGASDVQAFQYSMLQYIQERRLTISRQCVNDQESQRHTRVVLMKKYNVVLLLLSMGLGFIYLHMKSWFNIFTMLFSNPWIEVTLRMLLSALHRTVSLGSTIFYIQHFLCILYIHIYSVLIYFFLLSFGICISH